MYIKDDPHASYKLIGDELEKSNYSVACEVVGNTRTVTYTSPFGAVWSTKAANIIYPFASEEARNISINKEISYDYVKNSDISVPYTKSILKNELIDDYEIDNLIKKYKKLVVKPSNSSLSWGLTLGIESPDELREAIKVARAVNDNVLIQEQVDGEEVRFAIIDGKVVSALLRRTPRVVGDGQSKVSQLIKNENIERGSIDLAYINYPLLSDNIIDKSFMESCEILEKDAVLELNRATMIKNGCSVYDILSKIDPSYVIGVENLVKNLDTGFIVVDVFIADFTKEKSVNNHWFIEFNTSPVLKLFYGCRDGKEFDIVPLLAGSIDNYLHSKNML